MNVSFSTRGWQQIPWEQQVQMAETMRFGGVELYNVHKTPELTGRGGPLHRYTAAATARELWQKGLCIPCFDTACDIAGEDCTETVTALMQLAHDVQCPYVSVTAQRDDDARISAALEALLPRRRGAGDHDPAQDQRRLFRHGPAAHAARCVCLRPAGRALGYAPSLPGPRRIRRHDHQKPRCLRPPRSPARLGRRRQL